MVSKWFVFEDGAVDRQIAGPFDTKEEAQKALEKEDSSWCFLRETMVAKTITEKHCDFCDADLQGEPIPQEYLDAGFYGKGVTHYSRQIGITIRGQGDRVNRWACPDCGEEVDRDTGKQIPTAGQFRTTAAETR